MSLTADLRQSFRVLRSNPSFTAIAVATLALGIGANAAIFSVVNQVLLRQLPYPEPERIMALPALPGRAGSAISIPKFMIWRKARTFQAVAAVIEGAIGINLGEENHAEPLEALSASAAYFEAMGVRPMAGRTFAPSEDLPGAGKFAVLSFDGWKNRFAADPTLPPKPLF